MSIRFVPATLVAVLIALVAAGGAALAVGANIGGGQESRDDLLERTARELGLDPQAVKDAQAQAQSELAAERLNNLIDSMVENGTITQEQADEALAWFDAKPASVDRLLSGGFGNLYRFAAASGPVIVFETGHHFGGQGLPEEVIERMATNLGIDIEALKEALEAARKDQASDSRTDSIEAAIAKLVEEGELTQAEGDEIKAWLESMPEWILDHHLMIPLLTGEFGQWDLQGGIPGLPFFHEFNGDESPFPRLFEGLRGGPERFLRPDGNFEIPRFEFNDPGDGDSEDRYFYRGPEGQFDFEGEVPPEFRELFESMRGRFGEGFELPFDLEDLFEGQPHFEFSPFGEIPEYPEGADVTTESVKGV